jgi:hypothetical protein
MDMLQAQPAEVGHPSHTGLTAEGLVQGADADAGDVGEAGGGAAHPGGETLLAGQRPHPVTRGCAGPPEAVLPGQPHVGR